jgi:uncharacterized protein YqjF (DUF2071 family)
VGRAFLTAEWKYLAMLNYRVAPESLGPHVPPGTELDRWGGDPYVSLIGFHFRDTRIFGWPIPFHSTFEEVNLRFYVRREVDGDVRRGVTFIKETVPLPAVTTTARLTFNEPYETRPMRHRIEDEAATGSVSAHYSWEQAVGWGHLEVTAAASSDYPEPESHEEFITERHWGYTTQRDGSTIEYRVDHPRWRIWRANHHSLHGDLMEMYGEKFAKILSGHPSSALLAEGSAVTVSSPTQLRDIR